MYSPLLHAPDTRVSVCSDLICRFILSIVRSDLFCCACLDVVVFSLAYLLFFFFLFSSRGRHTRSLCDWSSDMCSSDLALRAAVRRAELEVEHAAHRGAERADVGVLDVATILAQMHGDAVGAAPLGRRRGAHGVGFVGAARLAHRRDVINVDVEPHAVLPSVHSAPTRGIVRETTTDRARRAGLPRVWGSRPGETRTAVASGDARAVHVRRESERPRADADAVGQ